LFSPSNSRANSIDISTQTGPTAGDGSTTFNSIVVPVGDNVYVYNITIGGGESTVAGFSTTPPSVTGSSFFQINSFGGFIAGLSSYVDTAGAGGTLLAQTSANAVVGFGNYTNSSVNTVPLGTLYLVTKGSGTVSGSYSSLDIFAGTPDSQKAEANVPLTPAPSVPLPASAAGGVVLMGLVGLFAIAKRNLFAAI
jgi:hypothetical protein